MVKQYVKLNNQIWYVKNFIDKLRKGQNNTSKAFYPIFKINLEEFRFYGEVECGGTPLNVSHSPVINLPPINQFFNNSALTPTLKRNTNKGSRRYSE
jgi:hypothetical protein